MNQEELERLVTRLTTHKLKYSRDLLGKNGLKPGRSQANTASNLVSAVQQGKISPYIIRQLADEHDAWGNQRIRLVQMPTSAISNLISLQHVEQLIRSANLEHTIDAVIPDALSEDLQILRTEYQIREGGPLLRIVAGKNTPGEQAAPEIPALRDDRYPEYIFKPYKEIAEPVISFAEVNLHTGNALTSTTLWSRQSQYAEAFDELISLIEPIMDFRTSLSIPLFSAVRTLAGQPQSDVMLYSAKNKTNQGGMIESRSHSARSDLRSDNILAQARNAVSNSEDYHGVFYWSENADLHERVHCRIYAPEGEVSIHGEVTEHSVRYVLRRILESNQ